MAVDARRVGRVVTIFCLATVVVVSAALFVGGARTNAEISQLRNQGIPIAVRVTHCIGLLSGSGSNAAGYACRGTYDYRGTG
ncbi:MAG TPA: hypothetical protein VEJ84_08530, partial [Acidimicrobiales bacterium]|nr:hypothetical protein [Acidimicrobiales bacterium]